MKLYTIDSISAVREFLSDIIALRQQQVLPEDEFFEYINEQGDLLFTEEEASYVDDIMLNCFVFCNDNRLDLYELCQKAWAHYKQSAVPSSV